MCEGGPVPAPVLSRAGTRLVDIRLVFDVVNPIANGRVKSKGTEFFVKCVEFLAYIFRQLIGRNSERLQRIDVGIVNRCRKLKVKQLGAVECVEHFEL